MVRDLLEARTLADLDFAVQNWTSAAVTVMRRHPRDDADAFRRIAEIVDLGEGRRYELREHLAWTLANRRAYRSELRA
jgi:hypothetical protein